MTRDPSDPTRLRSITLEEPAGDVDERILRYARDLAVRRKRTRRDLGIPLIVAAAAAALIAALFWPRFAELARPKEPAADAAGVAAPVTLPPAIEEDRAAEQESPANRRDPRALAAATDELRADLSVLARRALDISDRRSRDALLARIAACARELVRLERSIAMPTSSSRAPPSEDSTPTPSEEDR